MSIFDTHTTHTEHCTQHTAHRTADTQHTAQCTAHNTSHSIAIQDSIHSRIKTWLNFLTGFVDPSSLEAPMWPTVGPELAQTIGLCVPRVVVESLRGTHGGGGGGGREGGGGPGKRRRMRRRRRPLGRLLGHSWVLLGASWGPLGGFWGAFGGFFGASSAVLWRSWLV